MHQLGLRGQRVVLAIKLGSTLNGNDRVRGAGQQSGTTQYLACRRVAEQQLRGGKAALAVRHTQRPDGLAAKGLFKLRQPRLGKRQTTASMRLGDGLDQPLAGARLIAAADQVDAGLRHLLQGAGNTCLSVCNGAPATLFGQQGAYRIDRAGMLL